MKLSINQAKNMITKPTTAAIMCSLAAATACLSPPEVIHFIPPYIKKISAIITPIPNIIVIPAEIIPGTLPVVKAHKGANCPVGQMLTLVCAKTKGARAKYEAAAEKITATFFIY